MYLRYAIFFVPDAAWGMFGASWLGWDSRTGTYVDTDHWNIPDQPGLTKRPRKYGLHATLKAPFPLAQDTSQTALIDATRALCQTLRPIDLASLTLAQIGRFFALTAPDESAALCALAARAVTDIDRFRAPLTDVEIARRRTSRLTPAQDALLLRWGYPYVMDEYRFHITLTGPTKNPDLVGAQLRAALQDIQQIPLALDALSVMGEAEDGQFHQIARIPLTG